MYNFDRFRESYNILNKLRQPINLCLNKGVVVSFYVSWLFSEWNLFFSLSGEIYGQGI